MYLKIVRNDGGRTSLEAWSLEASDDFIRGLVASL